MTIATLHRVFSRTVLILGLASLVACGGGGGGGNPEATTSSSVAVSSSNNSNSSQIEVSSSAETGSSLIATSSIESSDKNSSSSLAGVVSSRSQAGTSSSRSSAPIVDTTPNPYSFTAIVDAELSAVIESAPVTISGINTTTTVSITGGEYSINGSAFTTSAGSISNGQSIVVRVTASASHSTTVSAQLTLGDVAATFSVTTKADTTPDAFTFEPANNAALDTAYTSNSITVSGIDAAVPISITDGEYSINGGEFTSAIGTVSVNNTVRLKGVSAKNNKASVDVIVTIGGVSAVYTITTLPDTIPPVAEFKFPTPYTMSEANSVKVRGTATDNNTITSVKVVVRSYDLATPDTTISSDEFEVTPIADTDGVKDFSSWTADITLTANAENEIKVIATDEHDNAIALEEANKVVIRQANGLDAFPNENNPFTDVSAGLVRDNYAGRNRLIVADGNFGKIYSVSLDTGAREIYRDLGNDGISTVWGMVIDDSTDEPVLYAKEYSEPNILKLNLASGEIVKSYRSELYQRSRALIMDEINGAKSLISINQGDFGKNSNVISFNLQTEQFSIISSDVDYPLMPSTWGLALDKARNRYLSTVRKVNENLYGIYSIDRETGERKAFSTNEVGSGELFIYTTALQEIAVDEQRNVLYVLDYLTGKIFSIDLITADRKVLADLTYKDANGEPLRIRLTSICAVLDNQYAYVSDSERDSLLVVDLTTGEKVVLSKSKNNF